MLMSEVMFYKKRTYTLYRICIGPNQLKRRNFSFNSSNEHVGCLPMYSTSIWISSNVKFGNFFLRASGDWFSDLIMSIT